MRKENDQQQQQEHLADELYRLAERTLSLHSVLFLLSTSNPHFDMTTDCERMNPPTAKAKTKTGRLQQSKWYSQHTA